MSAVFVRGRSYKILADVELTDSTEGVIFAHGSRFGGHSLFIKDQKLWYVYNFLGIPPEQQFVSDKLKPGKYMLGMEFKKEKTGQFGESYGTTTLYVNDKAVAKGPMRTQIGAFALTGGASAYAETLATRSANSTTRRNLNSRSRWNNPRSRSQRGE